MGWTQKNSSMIAIFLALAVTLDVACRSVIGYTSSSYYHDDYADQNYADCNGIVLEIADGYCDDENNNARCGWDGGDCCECTCISSGFTCGLTGYDCQDPDAPLSLVGTGCRNISFTIPQVSSCSKDSQVEWVVEDTVDATALAEATLCSGGDFEVEWKGHVDVKKTIYVLNGTSVRITGVLDAVADGGGEVQMLLVSSGYLYLEGLSIDNGNATDGGAIIGTSGSELVAESVIFNFNTAQSVGGAVYATSSNITLVSTTFIGNSAGYGGAIFVVDSVVVGSGSTAFINNSASGDGGALLIAESSFLGWNMQPVFPVSALEGSHNSTFTYFSYESSSWFSDPYNFSGSSYLGLYYRSETDVDWIDIDNSGNTVFVNNNAKGLGGAIFAEDCKISWSSNLSLTRNRAQYGGALYLVNNVNIQAQGPTTFDSNDAGVDGGAIGAATAAETMYGHSSFIANGPTTFINNSCGGSGGAIDLTEIRFVVSGELLFLNNSAVYFGGALYASQKGVGPTLIGTKFSDNFAKAGGAVFFSAVGTYELGNNDGEEVTMSAYSSKFIDCTFYGNSASSTGGALHSTAGKDLVEGTIFKRNSADEGGAMRISGTVSLNDCSFVENTSGEGRGPVVSNGGIISEMSELNFSGNGYHCTPNSFFDLEKVAADETRYETVCQGCDVECETCVTKDNQLTPVCTELYDHADSKGGIATLETLLLEAGYWRATNTSRIILECFNEEACEGGVTGNSAYCKAGYEGPYCAVCSKGYGKTLSYGGCSKCSENDSMASFVLTLIGSGVLALLFVAYMICIEENRSAWTSVLSMKAVLPLQSLKIIIIPWQIVTQFSMVANVVYPRLYQTLLDAIALVNFNISWIPSAGCIMDVGFHAELIAATTGPLVLMALLGFTYAIALHRTRGSEHALRNVQHKHANAAIAFALLLYSSASSAAFRAFACDSLDDGNVYLRSDYRIECDSLKHKGFQIYAGFMIAVYPVGIPALFAFILFLNREVLTSPDLRGGNVNLIQQSTSNLWRPYKPSVFYYEVVECGRRVMLTGVVIFIYPNTAAQIAVTLAIAFIFAFSSERLNPYNSASDGRVSRMSHIMVVLTMYEALLTKVDVSSEGVESQRIFGLILVAVHIVMICLVLVEAVYLIHSVRQIDLLLPKAQSPSICADEDYNHQDT